jgi:ubiquinone/menaquinone biosynthesis C-methylase UbiE
MVAEDIDNYIAEIARVMKLGGICLATYFDPVEKLLNLQVKRPRGLDLIGAGRRS